MWSTGQPLLQEATLATKRQDKALDEIEKGVGTMMGLAEGYKDTLKMHDEMITDIDQKVGLPALSRQPG